MTALDQNFSDLANILMQRRQMQAQQVQQDRANRLSDLQFKQLQREEDYQTGLRNAMTNPGGSGVTLPQLQPPQPQQNTLASLAPGNQLPFPQPQASFAPVEAKMSPSRAGAEYALGQGKIEDAVKLFSVDDHVAQLRAKGDLQGYYEAQRELEEGSKFFDVVNKFKANPKQLTALWPQIQRMFPQQSEGITPDSIKFNSDYTVLPLVMDGKTVPGKGILRDGEGKTSIIDTTPKEQPETWGEPYQTKVGGKVAMVQKSSRGQVRPVVQDVSTTVVVKNGGDKPKPAKPLPVSALKLQQDSVDAIGTASGIRSDLGVIRQQVESGQLKLGPIRNLAGAAANAAGMSTENSRNLATFKNTLEKLRNDSLRLNKGVQTDGDAQRAWNELMNNINDPGVVKQRLAEIDRINERAVVLHQANIDNIRNNYGQAPLDTSTQTGVKPALGKRSASTGKPAPKLSKKAQSIADRY